MIFHYRSLPSVPEVGTGNKQMQTDNYVFNLSYVPIKSQQFNNCYIIRES